jgi:hypothetical protein
MARQRYCGLRSSLPIGRQVILHSDSGLLLSFGLLWQGVLIEDYGLFAVRSTQGRDIQIDQGSRKYRKFPQQFRTESGVSETFSHILADT